LRVLVAVRLVLVRCLVLVVLLGVSAAVLLPALVAVLLRGLQLHHQLFLHLLNGEFDPAHCTSVYQLFRPKHFERKHSTHRRRRVRGSSPTEGREYKTLQQELNSEIVHRLRR
jgi:hypothetical protein